MDPPWAFRTFNAKNRTPTSKTFREAEDHYPTMPFSDMAALPVGQMMGRDAAIAMWVVGSHLDEALALGRAWGFTFTTDLFVWLKTKLVDALQPDLFTGDIPEPRMSMGYYTRKQSEACWLFTRGRGLPVLDHGVRQVIVAPSTGHSRKPPEQYDRLHRLFGGVSRIEMFARNTAPGWHAWGNEVGKFGAAAVDPKGNAA
jgi:N6-adenosine-specific RNA methylase IME4